MEAHERFGAKGEINATLDEDNLREQLRSLKRKGIESPTISLINSCTDDWHEKIATRRAAEELPGIPISLFLHVSPEMQAYKCTIATVCNLYVRPIALRYVRNLSRELRKIAGGVKQHILRSDGGLASRVGAETVPVSLLMSGVAGCVTGVLWIARQADFDNLLTFGMGGTLTDVCFVKDGVALLRRETTVGDPTFHARRRSMCSWPVRATPPSNRRDARPPTWTPPAATCWSTTAPSSCRAMSWKDRQSCCSSIPPPSCCRTIMARLTRLGAF